jgi:benzoyl-CoA reductase subunit BamC
MAKVKKTIKTIRIDADKCNGCRTCEIICSGYHSVPKYSIINPATSRIRIITHRLKNIWLPVFAGEYTGAECMGRDKYIIDGKEYDECSFCRATCPSRAMFKDPDSGLPLKCDMCEGNEGGPLCVEWCLNDVLIYEEREEEVDDAVEINEMETGLEALIDKYGFEKLGNAFSRRFKKN